MIPRILVPADARPTAALDTPTQRRRPTTMDDRTLVPAMLPIVPLDGHSTIPLNLPLESIATRVVVPRDVNREAYGVKEDFSTPVQPTDMDSRIVLPVDAAPPEMSSNPVHVPEDLVEPDVFITGEVNLTVPENKEARAEARKQVTTRLLVVYSLLISSILLEPRLFPSHEPTPAEMELARRQMTVLLPPGALEALKPPTRPVQPPPVVHVDPRVLREVAPPVIATPAPAPQPERPVKELPSAPVPKQNAVQPEPQLSAKVEAPKPVPTLETPDTPRPKSALQLPKDLSPGKSMEDYLKGSRPSGPRAIGGGGPVQGSAGHGGGGGRGTAYGGIEMLTDPQGLDWNSYLERVYYTVKRNWFAVMPGSVELGEKGIVYLTFRINRDGSVPGNEPLIERNSGKEPLDRAAYSSVRASSPFEPLPPQFKGPYIELRYRYYYNIQPNDFN
ncbi:MAG TPA: TonB C-terminal domain-containing protein [Candidatus Cybelea sp.]|nr:TonB C-terminal domain-containing protein [Candidatus Cybelea sp.]